MRRFRPRLTYANVMSTIAAFAALGTGAAVALPGQNKVNSGDVKNETLKTEDLKNDAAVQSSDVIDDSLTEGDLAVDSVGRDEIEDDGVEAEEISSGAVTADEIAFAAVGQIEVADNAVANAEMADDAVKSAEIAGSAVGGADLAAITQAVDPTPFDFGDQDEGNNDYVYGSSQATCPAGTVVVGGGGRWSSIGFGGAGGDELQAITESTRTGNGWTVWGVTDVDNDDLEAVAHCLSAGT